MKARTEMSLRIAKSRGNKDAEEKLKQLLQPHPEFDLHFANGFDHPQLVVYTNEEPFQPQLALWGLVPSWTKEKDRTRIQVQTLNARGETIFEKPAFRSSARSKRCLIPIEGYYEHHHFGKVTYPYFIHLRDRDHFMLAGLWEDFRDADTGEMIRTFSVVTTEGNELMGRIHNNPRLKGPRMPVILLEEDEEKWLAPANDPSATMAIEQLIRPYPAEAMSAHSVRRILGKEGIGNDPRATVPFEYPELALIDPLAQS